MKPRPSFLLVGGTLLAGLLLSGCWTISVHPLYSEETLIFDEQLLGTWTNEEATAEFTQASGKRYRIRYSEKNESSILEAGLVQLGEQRYLDVYPPRDAEPDSAVAVHRLSAHSFWKVSVKGDQMRLRPMDFNWLSDLISQDPKAIASVRVEKDLILLTATTAQLQEFVRRHSEPAFKSDEDADWQLWRRAPAPKKD